VVTDSTIANNTTQQGSGGGIRNRGTLNLANSIVAGNSAPSAGPDVAGAVTTDNGHNLLGTQVTASGPGDVFTDNPLLGPLQDNGGPTMTMAPLPGSPAFGAGDNTGGPATDQRGFARSTGPAATSAPSRRRASSSPTMPTAAPARCAMR